MIYKFKTWIAFAVLYSIVMIAAGCPAKTSEQKVRAAVDASYRLPATTNDLIAQINTANDQGLLSIEQTNQLGRYLQRLSAAEVIFVESVKALNATFEATGKFDPAKLKDLRTYLDNSIIGPFLDILQFTRVLSGPAAQAIGVAVTTLRLLMLTVGGGFGSYKMNALAAAKGI